MLQSNQSRGIYTAREREAYFQFKPNGSYYRLKSFLFGGAGDKDNVKVNDHRHDGRNFVSDAVMTGIDENISGTFSPYYSEMPILMRNFFGQPVSSALVDANYAVSTTGTRRREVFEYPVVGAPTIDLWGLQIGDIGYGRAKLESFNMDVMRNADGGGVTGNAAFHCNDILTKQGAVVPGYVAQNSKFAIVAANVMAGIGLAYALYTMVPGATVPRLVTITPGMTALQIKAAFEAFGDGVTVNVTGTIPATSPTNAVQTINTGTGYAGGATPFTITKLDGTTQVVNITPGDTLTAIGTNLAAPFGAGAVVTATGTSATGTPTSFAVSGAGTPAANGTYLPNNANLASPALNTPLYAMADGTNFSLINATGTTRWALNPSGGGGASYYGPVYASIAAAIAGGPIGTYYVSGGAGPAPTVTVASSTNGSLALSLAVSGSLAGVNVAQITSAAAGVTCATTTVGAAPATSGTVNIEFAQPTNFKVRMVQKSGDANYLVNDVQAGSDGTGPLYLVDSAPIEANNVLIYMTDTRAQMDAIAPDDMGSAFILTDALSHTFGVGQAWKAVWTENRSQSPSNFVANLPAITFEVTVWKGQNSELLRALQDGAAMGKKYFRVAYVNGPWQFWEDLKCVRNAAQDKANENDLLARKTPFIAADDPLSVFRVTCIGPASDWPVL